MLTNISLVSITDFCYVLDFFECFFQKSKLIIIIKEFMLNSGSYQLHIFIDKSCIIQTGKLGEFTFPKGNYVYTGSAMKNLKQRVERHLKNSKGSVDIKLHWHIDYLLANENVKIIKCFMFPSQNREECIRNQELLSSRKATVPINGFGSSDCNICKAHLVMTEN